MRHSALTSLRSSHQKLQSSPYLAGLRASSTLLHASPSLLDKIRLSIGTKVRPSVDNIDFNNTLLRRLNRTGLKNQFFSDEQRQSLMKKFGPEVSGLYKNF